MNTKSKIALDVIIFLLMILFIYAAASKLLDYSNFKHYLNRLPLFGRVAITMALGIPLVELLVAAMLFMPRFRLIGLYSSLVLMLGFTAYIAYMLFFVEIEKRPCACGGVLNSMNWLQHLIFNIVFILLAGIGIRLHTRQKEYAHSTSY
jgi:hypothetical protein